MRRIETYDWWPELVALKDELSLRELAEKFKVTPGAISAALKRTGTVRKPAPPGPRSRRKKKDKDEALPPEPGETHKPAPRPGSKDGKILPHYDLLGDVPDAEVADKAGVSVRTIASYRARHEIPGYSGPRRTSSARGPKKSKIDPFAELLGKVPDRVVAERAGVSLNAVRNYRVKRGIPAAGRRAKKDTAAPAPQATASTASTASKASTASTAPIAATGGDGAWSCRFRRPDGDEDTRVVVASGLADAATRAEGAGLGQVLELRWLGPTL